VSHTSMTDTTALRSHRAGESPEHYAHRLARARLKKSERNEIAAIYTRLDADRAIIGKGPAERAPWSPADILEWQDLTATERYLDLKGYANASDRITALAPPHLAIAA
jgi:hypothetical protein